MFGVARNAVLTSWAEKGLAKADYVEALDYENDTTLSPHNFRTGNLRGSQIEQWIHQADDYRIPDTLSNGEKLIGGLRLLICERRQYSPLDFSIEEQTFEVLEKAFRLPLSTLAIFDSEAGSYSKFLSFEDVARTKLKRIGIVLKAPQKREISNHALSLSYDVKTRFTTALLYGTGVPYFDEDVPGRTPSAVKGPVTTSIAPDAITAARQRASAYYYHGYQTEAEEDRYIVTAADEGYQNDFVTSLKGAKAAWNHPLVLPILLLTDHMQRAKKFCNRGKVLHETWAIEGELGVTYLGRKTYGSYRHQPSPDASLISRGKAEELNKRINTQSLRILFTARSPQWNRDCSISICNILDEIHNSLPNQLTAKEYDFFKELLEYNMATAESVGSHIASMKERMALQLDVLYNMVAQMDSRLSARLAASAGQDSTSMKILAFISALYLPGSFVSSLFSMSIFQWPHSSDASGSDSGNGNGSSNAGDVVSTLFWVYWATAIPLTAITLIGWGIWWVFEMRRFQRHYADVFNEAPIVDKIVQIPRRSWNLTRRLSQFEEDSAS